MTRPGLNTVKNQFKLSCLSLLWLLQLVCVSQPAQAFDFTEFAALSFSTSSASGQGASTLSGRPGFGLTLGGGISLGFHILEKLDLEAAILYVGQSFDLNQNGVPTSNAFWSAQIPFVVRYWLNDKFSVGTGPFYSRAIGNLSVTQGAVKSNPGFQDLQWTPNAAGLCISTRYKSNLSELISFVVDARGVWETTNRVNPRIGNLQTLSIQLWTGIAFIL